MLYENYLEDMESGIQSRLFSSVPGWPPAADLVVID